MIKEFYRPESLSQALSLKQQFGEDAVWFGGGSKINATPTRTNKERVISLEKLGLNQINTTARGLEIGASVTIQQVIDSAAAPAALKAACQNIYSRHQRNQATLGGEIAANLTATQVLPALIALGAQVELAEKAPVNVEDYVQHEMRDLIVAVILPNPARACSVRKIARSAGGTTVLSAAVSLEAGKYVIAVSGLSPRVQRLRDVEAQVEKLSDAELEKAVAGCVFPQADYCGSVEYKRYIAGVVVADLVADCKQMEA